VSRSRKDTYAKVVKPPKKHVKMILCDQCGERYPEDEVSVEIDEATKKVIGRFCGDCV
jgi:Pyruvate/2-oxoacid:ferredoxin oxidoreductase delta subunit